MEDGVSTRGGEILMLSANNPDILDVTANLFPQNNIACKELMTNHGLLLHYALVTPWCCGFVKIGSGNALFSLQHQAITQTNGDIISLNKLKWNLNPTIIISFN